MAYLPSEASPQVCSNNAAARQQPT